MILAGVYFLICIVWIWYARFFRQTGLSRQTLLLIFVLKCLGCFAYYWVYYVYYPGTFMCDTKSTMHDAGVIYSALPAHPGDYLRMVFGFHSEAESGELYQNYFSHMEKWHRQEDFEFFLNDNRTMTRINALVMLFSFGKYAVHALAMVLVSFVGQLFLYRTFKEKFSDRKGLLLLCVFFAPSLFFWTSGVLKEPIVILLMGLFLYTWFRMFVQRQFRAKHVVFLLLSAACFLVMKPYVLMLLLLPLLVYTWVARAGIRRVGLTYAVSLVGLLLVSVLGLKVLFKKDVVETIVKRQNDFVNLSYGGTFFLGHNKYVRFEYADSAMFNLRDAGAKLYSFEPHARYMYWNLQALQDTIRVRDNSDTLLYTQLAINAPAGSGIYYKRLEPTVASFLKMVPFAYYNVLCKPLFYDTDSQTELLASFENAVILALILFAICFGQRRLNDPNLFCFLLATVLLAFLLVGLTTTVSGAIVRYKAVFLPFLLMLPLMQLQPRHLARVPFLNRFA